MFWAHTTQPTVLTRGYLGAPAHGDPPPPGTWGPPGGRGGAPRGAGAPPGGPPGTRSSSSLTLWRAPVAHHPPTRYRAQKLAPPPPCGQRHPAPPPQSCTPLLELPSPLIDIGPLGGHTAQRCPDCTPSVTYRDVSLKMSQQNGSMEIMFETSESLLEPDVSSPSIVQLVNCRTVGRWKPDTTAQLHPT